MLKKITTFIVLSHLASAELSFLYEGYCYGKEIPHNYYSLVTHNRKAIIQTEKRYAVIRVLNEGASQVQIHDIDFEISPEERSKEEAVFRGLSYHIIRRTTTHHSFRPKETYRIFVPIPNCLKSGSGKIIVCSGQGVDDSYKQMVSSIEILHSQHHNVRFSSCEYGGLESRLQRTEDGQYTLNLHASGDNLTYFMYHRVLDTPMAIVYLPKENNNRNVGWFGYDEFSSSSVLRAALMPGDSIISAPQYIFTEDDWLEREDESSGDRRMPVPLVRCEDLVIIAQDFGMLNTGESEDEPDLNLEAPELMNENITIP